MSNAAGPHLHESVRGMIEGEIRDISQPTVGRGLAIDFSSWIDIKNILSEQFSWYYFNRIYTLHFLSTNH